MFGLDREGNLSLTNEVHDIFDNSPGETPNDIVVPENPQSSRLLYIGLRNGAVLLCRWDEQGHVILIYRRTMGQLPCSFVLTDNRLFVLSSLLAEIPLYSDNRHTMPCRVIVDHNKLQQIDFICPFFGFSSDFTYVAVIINDKQVRLTILQMDRVSKILPRRIAIPGTPRRCLFLDYEGCLAVLIMSKTVQQQPKLVFIDPRKSSLIPMKYVNDPVKPGSEEPFSQHEIVWCMAEWDLQIEKKRYKFLMIGSGFMPDYENQGGKVQVFRVKRTSEGEIELKRQYKWVTPAAVYSVAQLNNCSIVYSSQGTVYVQTLQLESLNEIPEYSLRSPVINLTTFEDKIIASTMTNSVYVLQLKDNKIVATQGDGIRRASINHVNTDTGMILISDKTRYITGLQMGSNETRYKPTLSKVFNMGLPTVINRIRKVNLKPVWSKPDAMILDNQYLASGIGGSLIALRLLNRGEVDSINNKLRQLKDEEELYDAEDINGVEDIIMEDLEKTAPLFPGEKWQEEFREVGMVINGDRLLRKYPNNEWALELIHGMSLSSY